MVSLGCGVTVANTVRASIYDARVLGIRPHNGRGPGERLLGCGA